MMFLPTFLEMPKQFLHFVLNSKRTELLRGCRHFRNSDPTVKAMLADIIVFLTQRNLQPTLFPISSSNPHEVSTFCRRMRQPTGKYDLLKSEN
ncbi:unnamed protein product [Caenorhabditis nigoni]